jgi:hypothetical protein
LLLWITVSVNSEDGRIFEGRLALRNIDEASNGYLACIREWNRSADTDQASAR